MFFLWNESLAQCQQFLNFTVLFPSFERSFSANSEASHTLCTGCGSSGFRFISTARLRTARLSSVTLLMTAVGFVFSRASGVARGMAKPFCQSRLRFGPDSEYHMKKLLDRWELNVVPTFLDRLDRLWRRSWGHWLEPTASSTTSVKYLQIKRN